MAVNEASTAPSPDAPPHRAAPYRDNARRLGRLVVSWSTQAGGCPVIDGARVEGITDGVPFTAQGVMIRFRRTPGRGLSVAIIDGRPFSYVHVRRLVMVPVLGALFRARF